MARAAPRKDQAKPGLALALRPRRQVVRRHRRGEARLLGVLDVAQERAGGDLLVGAVEADDGHRSTQPHRGGGQVAHLRRSVSGCPAGRAGRGDGRSGGGDRIGSGGEVGRGAPGGRRRRRGLRHGRWHHRVGPGAARGRRARARARRAAAARAGELVAGRGLHQAPLQAGRRVGGRRGPAVRARACTTSSAGNTKVYGASLPRFRESDFEEVAHLDGVSPAWPFRYDDLEPFYGDAERLYAVHGTTGEDPTEPWRSTPFPYAALPHEPYVAALVERLRAAGVSPCVDGDGRRPAAGRRVRAVRDLRRVPVPARRQVGCRGVRHRPRARDRVGPVGDVSNSFCFFRFSSDTSSSGRDPSLA